MTVWYNTDKLNKYAKDAKLRFIVGGRGIGKTMFFLKQAIDDYQTDKSQTLWLRNLAIELADPSFIQSFLNGPKRLGWCPDEWITKPDGVYTGKDGDLVIKFQSINTFSNMRGSEHKRIRKITLDEFMPESGKYPKRPHIALMSILETVFRKDIDCECNCLSNFVSASNPYFVGFRIYPERRYDVTPFRDKRIAIEVCRGYEAENNEDNPWTKVYKAGGYQTYCDPSEDSLFSLVTKLPGNGFPWHVILLSEGVYYEALMSEGLYYFHPITNLKLGQIVFACRLHESGVDTPLIQRWVIKQLKEWAELNQLRFNSPNTLQAIMSLIYDTV